MANRKLDFIVVGVPKAGTTALFELLKQHPNIYIPPSKELPFFSEVEAYKKGFEWYVNHNFKAASKEQLIGTITPQYMSGIKNIMPRDIAERIHKDTPDSKLIVVLRDPIERAYSHYKMAVRRGHEEEDFTRAIKRELRPENIQVARKYSSETNPYVAAGEYGRILKDYLKFFDRKNIKIVFTNDLKSTPQTVVNEIFEFLQVENDFIPEGLGQEVHSGSSKAKLKILTPAYLYKIPFLDAFWNKLTPYPLRRRVNWAINRWNMKKSSDDKISEETIKILRKHYASDSKILSKFVGSKLPWN